MGSMGKSSALTAYALLLPALLALAIFRLYPIAATLWGSLNTESFEKAGTSVFAVGANYADLFTDPVFWGSIWVTVKLNLVINPLQIILALGLSLMANQRFPGIHFYRLRAWIIYDEQVALNVGYLLASLPVEPQDGGYYWTRMDQADPGRLKPFTSNLQSLSHCLIANSKRLHAILSQPGNRSAGLASLPATLSLRY